MSLIIFLYFCDTKSFYDIVHGTSAPSHQIGDKARRRQNVYRMGVILSFLSTTLGALPLHATTSLRDVQ